MELAREAEKSWQAKFQATKAVREHNHRVHNIRLFLLNSSSRAFKESEAQAKAQEGQIAHIQGEEKRKTLQKEAELQQAVRSPTTKSISVI